MPRLRPFSALAALLVTALPALAAELVMYERAGCVWCARWDREVGAVYDKTDEGKRVPLRRVRLDQKVSPADRLDPPVVFSPTFVLKDGGREIGRITGYLGDDQFWGLYSILLKRHEARQP